MISLFTRLFPLLYSTIRAPHHTYLHPHINLDHIYAHSLCPVIWSTSHMASTTHLCFCTHTASTQPSHLTHIPEPSQTPYSGPRGQHIACPYSPLSPLSLFPCPPAPRAPLKICTITLPQIAHPFPHTLPHYQLWQCSGGGWIFTWQGTSATDRTSNLWWELLDYF